MKKQLIMAIVSLGGLLSGTINTQAQSNSTVANANLILADVISFDSGASVGGAVDFNYVTSADYNSAKTAVIPLSLVITSSKNFDIKVKAGGVHFLNGSNSIPLNVLKIKAVIGGTMIGSFRTIVLSTADQKLVKNALKGSKKSLSIEYSISAAKATAVLLGKPAGTYKQTITYTATTL
jgi:hypothetical protein